MARPMSRSRLQRLWRAGEGLAEDADAMDPRIAHVLLRWREAMVELTVEVLDELEELGVNHYSALRYVRWDER